MIFHKTPLEGVFLIEPEKRGEELQQTIDDLDGSVLEEGEGTRIVFSLEGRTYEIDLSASNAEKFRSAFAPYVDAARSVRSAGTGRARPDRTLEVAMSGPDALTSRTGGL